TGLYHTQARYYSPVLARFLSEDPLRHGAGVNFFDYAGNDPINQSDTAGLYLSEPGVVPPGSSITSPMDSGMGTYLLAVMGVAPFSHLGTGGRLFGGWGRGTVLTGGPDRRP